MAGLAALSRSASLLVTAASLLLAGRSQPAAAVSWVEEYPAVASRTSAACKAAQREECRAGLEQMAELLDGRPDVICRLAHATLELGNVEAAIRHLQICVGSGLEIPDPAADASFARLRELPEFEAIERTYRELARPVGSIDLVHRLGDPGLVAEDVVFDASDRSFLVSSVHQRKIVRVTRTGQVGDAWRPGSPEVWGVFALALDRSRNVLWATTTAGAESPPFTEAERGRSVILRLDAGSFAVRGRYQLEDSAPHGFGDATLGDRGEPYISDGIGGGVYTVDENPTPHLRTIVAPGKLRSPQTPARLAGTTRLLVPDYSRGIAIVDLAGGDPAWLAHPPELALSGIDGMYARGRTLIAIQNGTSPERILVLGLDPTCSRITSWRVALARVAGLGDPTHGTFVGPEFFFIANSGWDRVADNGELRNGPSEEPAALWRLPLRPGEAVASARCENSKR